METLQHKINRQEEASVSTREVPEAWRKASPGQGEIKVVSALHLVLIMRSESAHQSPRADLGQGRWESPEYGGWLPPLLSTLSVDSAHSLQKVALTVGPASIF